MQQRLGIAIRLIHALEHQIAGRLEGGAVEGRGHRAIGGIARILPVHQPGHRRVEEAHELLGLDVEEAEVLAPSVLACREIRASGLDRASLLVPSGARADFGGVIEDDERPDWVVVWVFVLGTVLMRSAGCALNDRMLGRIYVLQTPYFARTGADGKADLVWWHGALGEVVAVH